MLFWKKPGWGAWFMMKCTGQVSSMMTAGCWREDRRAASVLLATFLADYGNGEQERESIFLPIPSKRLKRTCLAH